MSSSATAASQIVPDTCACCVPLSARLSVSCCCALCSHPHPRCLLVQPGGGAGATGHAARAGGVEDGAAVVAEPGGFIQREIAAGCCHKATGSMLCSLLMHKGLHARSAQPAARGDFMVLCWCPNVSHAQSLSPIAGGHLMWVLRVRCVLLGCAALCYAMQCLCCIGK